MKKIFSLILLFGIGCASSVIEQDASQSSTKYLGARSEFLTEFRAKEQTASALGVKYLDLFLKVRELEVGYILLKNENKGQVTAMQEQAKLASDALQFIQVQQEESITNAIANIDPLDAEGVLELSLTTFQFEFRKIFGPSSRRWRAWNYRKGNVKSFDETCEDVVEHQLLGEIADSVLKDDRARYVATLARMIRAIDCQDLETSIALDSGLAHAYRETIKRFPEKMQRMVRRAMVSSLTNVMLAVYDETKVVGFTALTDWFAENRNAIAEAYSTRYSAASLIGLWVREPAADRMTKIKLCEEFEVLKYCISVSHLVDSLLTPYRLGLGNCAAAEMFSPTMDEVGYLCQKGVCDNEEKSPVLASPWTQYGAQRDTLKDNSCQGVGLGTGGWKGLGGGLTGVGGAIASAVISCTTDSISNSGPKRAVYCSSDVVSSTSAPLTPTYTTHQTNSCGNYRAEGAGDNSSGSDSGSSNKGESSSDKGESSSDKSETGSNKADNASSKTDQHITDSKQQNRLDEAKSQAAKDLASFSKQIIEAASKIGVHITEEEIIKAYSAVLDAQGVKEAYWVDYVGGPNSECASMHGCTGIELQTGNQRIVIREWAIVISDIDALVDLLKHEAGHVILDNACIVPEVQHDIINRAWHWGTPGKTGYYHQMCQVDDTCASSCSPMMEKVKELMTCINDGGFPSTSRSLPIFRPVSDPSPENAPINDTKGAEWLECFRNKGGLPGVNLNATFCTAMTCSDGIPSVVGGRCQCGGGSATGGGLKAGATNSCAWAMCPDGSGGRASPEGLCRCDSATTLPAVPPIPPTPGPEAPSRPGDIYPF